MTFKNQFIKYYLFDNDVLVVKYRPNKRIDRECAVSIVADQTVFKARGFNRFIGVIPSSTQFTSDVVEVFATKEALKGVEMIAVVFVGETPTSLKLYILGVAVLNFLVNLVGKNRKPLIRFFTDINKAIEYVSH